ncbi:MAG TPA: YggS family pyridoxal phosphate-dependent enzyme, partial [Candidatus Omnitrophica bacterium]|nr:YggS family pyridoxal phosphate-dependent enzyme [Candidatus Omnitrophota bacterium]
SLDSVKVAQEIERFSLARNKRPKVFIEVNTSKEETKFGVAEEEVLILADKISGCSNLELIGFMTIAPFSGDDAIVRQAFKRLRLIRDDISRRLSKNLYLSMGMSDDFETAIEEGADFIRIGRAIFGERD